MDGFPLLSRVSMLLVNNNKVYKLGEDLYTSLPNLQTLILTGNNVEDLQDLNPLGKLTKLTHVSLMRNPVTTKPKYRLYLIHICPSIRVLDYKKVRLNEREAARRIFGSKKSENKVKTFVPGEGLKKGPTPKDREAIKAAIAKASSLDEIRRLEMSLNSGSFPGF